MGVTTQTVDRAGQPPKYALTSDEDDTDFWGPSYEAEGLFTPLPGEEAGVRHVRFVGCSPQGGLLRSVGSLGTRHAEAGSGWISVLDNDGATMGSYFVGGITVLDARPSVRGAGLLDLTVTLWSNNTLPGADGIWELVRSGRLDRPGMWHELDPVAKHAWLSVALWSHAYHRRGKPEAPAGQVVILDGRYTTDEDSFYCAIGEAVNGPGGYFGWNLDALDDCLCGGWGATRPFTVRWLHSAVAVEALRKPEPTNHGERPLLDLILEIFEARGVPVELR